MAANEALYMYTTEEGRKLQVVHGDLTQEAADAIVNAANERLAHGGGVAGAIVRRGGAVIQRESRAWVRVHGPVATGSAAITSGGALAATYVIHAVGPVWRGNGDEPALLRSAVVSALTLADAHGLHSISLPAISSGIFGFPKPLAAEVIIDAVTDYLASHPTSGMQVVRFCNIDRATTDLFVAELRRRFDRA